MDTDRTRSRSQPFGPSPQDTLWHTHSAQKVLDLLEVERRAGLSPKDARHRRLIFGENRIAEGRNRHPLSILLDQFRDFTVWILIVAAFISGMIGEKIDIAVILAIILINAILGFTQEFRAEIAIASLKTLSVSHATVIRGGKQVIVPASDLVPGDIVQIEAGNKVPADLRLLEVVRLKVDESALTGESQPVDKTETTIEKTGLFLGERRNMAYSGTLATDGHGTGVVVATGMDTEIGRIARLLHSSSGTRSPLEIRLSLFGRQLSVAILVLCSAIFIIGIARHEKIVPMLLTVLSLAIAAIPESLPAVVKIALSLGARKMVEKKVLVRRLSAVETLGSVSTICTDKTGTLTQNLMKVEEIVLPRASDPSATETFRTMLLEAMVLNNNANLKNPGEFRGDPTEVALLEWAESAGYSKEETNRRLPRSGEIPFSSERSLMSTLHERSGSSLLFSKGSPERILAASTNVGPDFSLDRDEVLLTVRRMGEEGLRVLAFAYCERPETIREILVSGKENGLTFIGLVGLRDPPRPEAGAAIALCKSAGIRVVMITGDHPETARAIARNLGISGKDTPLMTGEELEALSVEDYGARVRDINVYARVSPLQKVRIVTALQDRGEVVAMTGDGINDAPSLHLANIGIAMGRSGTDVAREASHMILLDDNFSSIVMAVREGRRITDNIRKFVHYVLTGNAGEIIAIVVAPILGWPVPLLPIHILWVNLVTDGLPGLALSEDPPEPDVMNNPPRPLNEGFFSRNLILHILAMGSVIGGMTLLTQFWATRSGTTHGQTMTFTVLTFSQMAYILSIRSDKPSAPGRIFFENPPLTGAILITGILQLAILYLPPLNRIFRTQPLTPGELLLTFGLSFLVFLFAEGGKWLDRHTQASRQNKKI
jgi:Ca2+-transporting ATPase